MDRYLFGNRQSVHEVGLTDLFDIARLSDTFPSRRALVGIEPASLDWGDQLSPSLQAVVPEAANQVLRLIHSWRD
jgi:hydrogenase maturation protease